MKEITIPYKKICPIKSNIERLEGFQSYRNGIDFMSAIEEAFSENGCSLRKLPFSGDLSYLLITNKEPLELARVTLKTGWKSYQFQYFLDNAHLKTIQAITEQQSLIQRLKGLTPQIAVTIGVNEFDANYREKRLTSFKSRILT